jgi:hypothetical protein
MMLFPLGRLLATPVAYLGAADNVPRVLPIWLRVVNQPVLRARNPFSSPHLSRLACLCAHLSRSTPQPSLGAVALDRLRLGPRRHANHQHFSQAPDMISESRRHRWRARPPPLGGAGAIGRFGNHQRLAQARMG